MICCSNRITRIRTIDSCSVIIVWYKLNVKVISECKEASRKDLFFLYFVLALRLYQLLEYTDIVCQRSGVIYVNTYWFYTQQHTAIVCQIKYLASTRGKFKVISLYNLVIHPRKSTLQRCISQ